MASELHPPAPGTDQLGFRSSGDSLAVSAETGVPRTPSRPLRCLSLDVELPGARPRSGRLRKGQNDAATTPGSGRSTEEKVGTKTAPCAG